MQGLILFLLLSLFLPLTGKTLPTNPPSQEWLGCIPSHRFASLTHPSVRDLSGYREQLVPYLIARGVNDEEAMERLVQEDLSHLAQAFSILFEQDPAHVLHQLLGNHLSLIEGYQAQIDHVGRELLGPLSFYLPLLERIAPQLGLVHLRDLVFSSTQVVKVLQQHDPSLQGVTIGRAYFRSVDNGKVGCLELFQASPQDEKSPQHIEATKERLSLLNVSTSNSLVTPIDHLSIELSTLEEVQHIHERIHQLTSETLLPNQKELSHNPGDGSTQTKALIRESRDIPFNKIVEFVHYSRTH